MPLTLIVRSVGSLALRAVRRLLSDPSAAGRTPSLTIGAVHMNEKPQIPDVPGVPTTRRGLGYEALLGLAQDLLIARFALTRALDKLSTEDLLGVLDEVDETIESKKSLYLRPITTLRDDKP